MKMKLAVVFTFILVAFGGMLFTKVQAKEISLPKVVNFNSGISGNININGINYKWSETSWSRNRGMTFNPGKHVYQFSPNPHDDPWYNKNQQKFYNLAATEIKRIGDGDHFSKENWLSMMGVTVHGVEYTLRTR